MGLLAGGGCAPTRARRGVEVRDVKRVLALAVAIGAAWLLASVWLGDLLSDDTDSYDAG